MKKIMFLTLAMFVAGAVSAQKLVIGEKAPELKVAEWLSGEPSTEGKALLIEFFHTSSKPSVARLETLDSLANRYSDRLNVAVVSKEAKERVEEILQPGSRAYYPALDDAGRTFESFGVSFVPFGVLVDKKGRVVWFGNPSSLDEETLEGAL